MVLDGEQIVLVLAGSKTQARRPVTSPQRARRARQLAANGMPVADVAQLLRCSRAHVHGLLNGPDPAPRPPYRQGQSVKVLRRSRVPACRVKIQAVWQQPLDQVNDEQARREGHKSASQFRDWWQERYHGAPYQQLWVLEFELDGSHRPRLLAGRHGDQHGYTESTFNALKDEPEAVPEGWQRQVAQAAYERDHALRLLRSEQLLRERSRKRRAA